MPAPTAGKARPPPMDLAALPCKGLDLVLTHSLFYRKRKSSISTFSYLRAVLLGFVRSVTKALNH